MLAETIWKSKLFYSFNWHLSIVILIILLFSPIGCLNARDELKPRNELFGVQLNNEAKSLLIDVERIFGKPVKEEWYDEANLRYGAGNSKVNDDGTPIIYVNRSYGPTIDVIVHELYHFILRDRGYPVILWLFPNHMDNKANGYAFDQLAQQVYDPILHYIFYREIRDWSIHPGKTFEVLTKKSLETNSLANIIASMDEKAIGLYYFKIRLEIRNSDLFQDVVELLTKKQKEAGLLCGKKLTQIVIDNNPNTPRSAVKTLVNCLNTFYEDSFHFKQHTWLSRQLGNHTQQIVPIEMKPLAIDLNVVGRR